MFGYGGDRNSFANSCMIEGRVKIHAFFMVFFVSSDFQIFFLFLTANSCGRIWFHSSFSGSFSRICGIFEGGSCLFVDGVLARIPFSQHAFLLEPGEFSPVVNCCEYFPHEN